MSWYSYKQSKILLLAFALALVLSIGLIIGIVVISNKSDNDSTITTAPPLPTDVVTHKYVVSTRQGFKDAGARIKANLDFGVDPCSDFYTFACGAWEFNNPIPATSASLNQFSLLADRVSGDTVKILNDLNPNNKTVPGSIKKLTFLYKACMDLDGYDTNGGTPLLTLMSTDKKWTWPLLHSNDFNSSSTSPEELIALLRSKFNVNSLLTSFVFADDMNTTFARLHIDQAFLGMGKNTEAYYKNPADNVAIAYKTMMKTVANLLAQEGKFKTPKESDFDDIFTLESSIADEMAAQSERRNAHDMYNFYSKDSLKKNFTEFDWDSYFVNLLPTEVYNKQYRADDFSVIIVEPDYVRQMSHILKSQNQTVVANYLVWRMVQSQLPYLSAEYRNASQTFKNTISGSTGTPDQQGVCLTYAIGPPDSSEITIGYATGRVFVDHYFSPESQMEASTMVANLLRSFESLVEHSTWMDAATKQTAQNKAASMIREIGYPQWIKNDTLLDLYYDALDIKEEYSFFKINNNHHEWGVAKQLLTLLKPYDRADFGGSPAVVNAWYDPPKNCLVFPAAIIQEPFFRADFPKAVNYGALGAVIGHEITHGFDDQGAQYDQFGNLNNWWSSGSLAQFENKTECIVDYDYCYKDLSICINGSNTQGENIADNGGLRESYYAYQTYKHENGDEPRLPGLESYTSDQILFLSFASFWCSSYKPAALRQQILTNEHSPSNYRVIGALQNMNEFSSTFNCPINSYMNPTKKCHIW